MWDNKCNHTSKKLQTQLDFHDACEYIQTLNKGIFPLSNNDIQAMSDGIYALLKDRIASDDIVGLFLSFCNMQLLPLLLYNSFRQCGAALLRLGTTNMERQIWLTDIYNPNVLVCSLSMLNHLKTLEKQTDNKKIICYGTENDLRSGIINDVINNIELFFLMFSDMPAYLIRDRNGWFSSYPFEIDIMYENNNTHNVENNGALIIKTNCTDDFSIPSFHTCIKAKEILSQYKPKRYELYFENDHDNNVETVRNKIIKIIRRYKQSDTTNNGEIKLDSLTRLELLVALEQEFSFVVAVDEVNQSIFQSIDNLELFVISKIHK